MKKHILYLIFGLLLSGCSTKLTTEQSNQLWKAYKEKNFFVLHGLMSKITTNGNNPDLMLYQATLDNVFNNPALSNKLINKLLDKYSTHFNDSVLYHLYSMREQNALRLQDYESAYKDNSFIIEKYKHVCDSSELESNKDDNTLIHNLVGVAKMEVLKDSDSHISLKRDIAGLFNVPVIVNNDTTDFIFDTGANFSVITETLALKYGVKPMGDKVKIGTATGIKVLAGTGLLNIRLGNIEVKNTVFLILPDSALSFANGVYIIKGIVGFPVMNALQEFSIKDDNTLFIPKTAEQSKERNFALDDLFPVIMVNYNNDTLPFHFDTGATSTDLYSKFFNKYKEKIIRHATKRKLSIGGAGGSVESEVYILDSATFSAGNSQCRIDSMRISEKDLKGSDVKYIYGNFGQDYIKKFKEMRINFASMHISFMNLKK